MRRFGRAVTVLALGFVGVLLQAYADPIADLIWTPRKPSPAPELDPALVHAAKPDADRWECGRPAVPGHGTTSLDWRHVTCRECLLDRPDGRLGVG